MGYEINDRVMFTDHSENHGIVALVIGRSRGQLLLESDIELRLHDGNYCHRALVSEDSDKIQLVSRPKSNVVDIHNFGTIRRSEDLKSSIARVRRFYFKSGTTWKLKSSQRSVSEEMDLTKNIEYYKKHGTLPSNTDMQKIQGKGDAYESNRG